MKFKFKVQQYQTDAADAVTSVFEGQPNQGASVYLRDLGRKPKRTQGKIDFGDESTEGYANAPVALSASGILANVRAVQRRNQIPESEELFCGMGACQLDVEMETGTGKTYVYTKTMLELNRLYGWCKFIVVVPRSPSARAWPRAWRTRRSTSSLNTTRGSGSSYTTRTT